MNPETVQKLLSVNRQFYQTFALQFSATRQRLQPGVYRVLKELSVEARLLDIGCGNGELWRSLAAQGYQGSYVGLDFSPGLLEEASAHLPPDSPAVFLPADLSSHGWAKRLFDLPAQQRPPYDRILAFAVLHHLPGRELRSSVLQAVRELLSPGGKFTFSVWQFLNSSRLRERIQPPQSVGASPSDLEAGDYILDWRSGGTALRYVHSFSASELETLAHENGFRILEDYYSDGEGGRLGLYQTWQPV